VDGSTIRISDGSPTSEVNTLAISNDGDAFVSAGADKLVRVCPLLCTQTLDECIMNVIFHGLVDVTLVKRGCLFCVEGSLFSCYSLTLPSFSCVHLFVAVFPTQVWNYEEGVVYFLGFGHSGSVNRVAIAPDQKHIISVGAEGSVFIWKMPKVPAMLSK
jgi:WD40 repeat protein